MARLATEIRAAEYKRYQLENELLTCKSRIDQLKAENRQLEIQEKKRRYHDKYHRNRSKRVNDFIFVSKKSDDTNSFVSSKILHSFMNLIAIDETCSNEIIAYLNEPDNLGDDNPGTGEALCSKLKDKSSCSQGKGFFEP